MALRLSFRQGLPPSIFTVCCSVAPLRWSCSNLPVSLHRAIRTSHPTFRSWKPQPSPKTCCYRRSWCVCPEHTKHAKWVSLVWYGVIFSHILLLLSLRHAWHMLWSGPGGGYMYRQGNVMHAPLLNRSLPFCTKPTRSRDAADLAANGKSGDGRARPGPRLIGDPVGLSVDPRAD